MQGKTLTRTSAIPAARAPGQPGRPRKLTRQRIVDAAVQALDDEGYRTLSMRSLAQRLGVNHATLYNYVGHIEDVETEALASLLTRVPIPGADRPATMREQLIEHLLALRELQLQHPHVLHAPVGSPTWQSHQKTANRVLRALLPHGKSLVEVALAYTTLIASMASNAERARASGTANYSEYIAAQRAAIRAVPAGESELMRRVLANSSTPAPSVDSLPEILNYLIDRLLPDIDRKRKGARK